MTIIRLAVPANLQVVRSIGAQFRNGTARAERIEGISRLELELACMHGSRVTYSAILCHDFCTMYEPIAHVVRYARGKIIRGVSPLIQ